MLIERHSNKFKVLLTVFTRGSQPFFPMEHFYPQKNLQNKTIFLGIKIVYEKINFLPKLVVIFNPK